MLAACHMQCGAVVLLSSVRFERPLMMLAAPSRHSYLANIGDLTLGI